MQPHPIISRQQLADALDAVPNAEPGVRYTLRQVYTFLALQQPAWAEYMTEQGIGKAVRASRLWRPFRVAQGMRYIFERPNLFDMED